ncbi:peptidylprolyl isomerase [Stenomitos frigidus]|uniref:peptidylprolyl isomerase n=1 Tax=Stenomitos frigidus ULC18 TaxID=2107698 RepID=A0A2T1E6L6_9CYAN|nr:peptidylprolyl isomerase [Stenomitos frigidus]PSB28379.1 hypothetical protein C7B82_13675 [Stenomitos frigidus ULC18]
MSNCLKIGDYLLNGDQIISALVRYKLLEPMVGQILLDEVIKEVPLSKQELFYTLFGATEAPIPEDFEGFIKQWCQIKGVTLDYFSSVVLRELQVQKFKQLRFASQIESEFLRIKSELDQVEYSVIQLTHLPRAQELYFQLRDDGADFMELAQQYSLGSERLTGGRVGPVPLSTLPIEVGALFRNEQVGTVYGPIPVADGFWVVRLEQFTAARLNEATRADLMNRLYEEWLQTQTKAMTEVPGTIAVLSDAVLAEAVSANAASANAVGRLPVAAN